MKIAEIYSHLNGYEWLQIHKPELIEEIEAAVASVDAEACRTKVSKEIRMKGKRLYSPKDMNKAFSSCLEASGWESQTVTYYVTKSEQLIRKTLSMDSADQKREIEAAGDPAIRSYNQTDFVKERVAIEVQFGKYSFIAYDLFVKHIAFYVRDEIDCGIEILPMKCLQSEMSSGPGYYEGALYDVIRQGRGVPAVPLVLIGIEP